MGKNSIAYIFLFVVASIAFAGNARAQDIHFSHYRGAPLIVNPAHTGAYTGDFQFGSIYRNQWRTIGNPFQTFAASYDQKLFLLPGDLAVGIIAANDKSGNLGLTQTKLMLSGGYHHQLGRGKIGVGVQFGMVWKSLNLTDITFPQQYSRETGGFDPLLESGEMTLGDQLSFFDANAGILYRTKTNWGNFLFGYGALHLTQPKESFLDRNNQLSIRQVFEMRSEIRLNADFFITPSLYLQTQDKAQELLPGMAFGTYLTENSFNAQKVYLNMAMRNGFERNGDAFILTAAADFKFIDAAISYDINYSDLNAATSSRGGIEFSLIYRGLSSELVKQILPCDRY